VLEIALPDRSGFEVLMELVPRVIRPHGAVIVLTQLTYRGLWEAAKQNGAYGCVYKSHTTGEDLDKAVQRAVALVGQLPKEERYQPI
jgi:DNA-binding NarL/FixJ family response regulator